MNVMQTTEILVTYDMPLYDDRVTIICWMLNSRIFQDLLGPFQSTPILSLSNLNALHIFFLKNQFNNTHTMLTSFWTTTKPLVVVVSVF